MIMMFAQLTQSQLFRTYIMYLDLIIAILDSFLIYLAALFLQYSISPGQG